MHCGVANKMQLIRWLYCTTMPRTQGVRFEEFDFSYYNRTPFTGLENDLANCYTNALLQARVL